VRPPRFSRFASRSARLSLVKFSLALSLAPLFVPCLAPEALADPAPTNNWNQWDDDGRDGVVQGSTKVALGVDYALVGSSDHTVRLALELEHLLRNRWGLVGTVALPVAGTWVAPASLGVRFHLLPKLPIDPFLGLGGGVAWLAPSGLRATAAPLGEARTGLAFYALGFFFAQLEGGYDFVRYGRAGVEMDRGGASFAGRLGVYF
jgi:hypothetical protein